MLQLFASPYIVGRKLFKTRVAALRSDPATIALPTRAVNICRNPFDDSVCRLGFVIDRKTMADEKTDKSKVHKLALKGKLRIWSLLVRTDDSLGSSKLVAEFVSVTSQKERGRP